MNNPTDAARDSVLTEFDVNPHFTDCGCSVCVASRRLADEIVRLRNVLSTIGELHKKDITELNKPLDEALEYVQCLKDALLAANGMLRSCYQVVVINRAPKTDEVLTNWDALHKQLDKILIEQHRLIHPERYVKLGQEWVTKVTSADFNDGCQPDAHDY